jgi:hypothetical protein
MPLKKQNKHGIFVKNIRIKQGFYTEFDGDSSDFIHLKTSIGFNAFAQFFMANGKSFYIYKASLSEKY